MENSRLEAALAELSEEERRLSAIRAAYHRIMRSRFHALRMLWFSLKQVLGLGSPGDRFAMWSVTDAPVLVEPAAAGVHPLPAVFAPTQAFSSEEERLRASWAARAAADAGEPDVTIVIPAYNHCAVTMRCLQSLADTWFEHVRAEIVLVDDASTDETPRVFAGLPGLVYLRNAQNAGFVRSCNRGAAIARGRYICFLNNDTTLTPGWLDRLVERGEGDETIGALGSKLVYSAGTLQEAGGIIWRDATGWNYGRNGDAADSRYNYVREVDYCSGAALMVRASLWRSIGGFDERFAPAYYEDVDLCFAVRDAGYRVVYEPRSTVIHYEGVTSGTDTASGVKHFQEVNRPKFQAKWNKALEAHLSGSPENVPAAARRLRTGPMILMIDSYVPMHDRDAGSLRLLCIIEMLRAMGYEIMFLGDNYAALQPYTERLQQLGVEVLHHIEGGRKMEHALDEALALADVAWICRPNLFEKYAPIVRKRKQVKLVYDTIDMHFLREKREAELVGNADGKWRETQAREIACAKEADLTVVVCDYEKELLAGCGISSVGIIPTIHEAECENPPPFEDRSGILFIGGYNHTPNVDAAKWLCKEILPIVLKSIPDATVTLLGSNPPPEVEALASERVRVTGYVPDVSSFFLESRLFAAPIRYGAGLKGKVGHALGFGLPVVATTVASEGFYLESGKNVLLADDTQAFAKAIVRLHSDAALWNRISAASFAALIPFSSATVAPRLDSMLRELQRPSRAMAKA